MNSILYEQSTTPSLFHRMLVTTHANYGFISIFFLCTYVHLNDHKQRMLLKIAEIEVQSSVCVWDQRTGIRITLCWGVNDYLKT